MRRNPCSDHEIDVLFEHVGLELAIDPPKGEFVHYDFLKLHYIRRKIKDVSPLRVAA